MSEWISVGVYQRQLLRHRSPTECASLFSRLVYLRARSEVKLLLRCALRCCMIGVSFGPMCGSHSCCYWPEADIPRWDGLMYNLYSTNIFEWLLCPLFRNMESFRARGLNPFQSARR